MGAFSYDKFKVGRGLRLIVLGAGNLVSFYFQIFFQKPSSVSYMNSYVVTEEGFVVESIKVYKVAATNTADD